MEIAASIGIKTESPRILKDSNNTIVHLVPSSIVAKVGTSTIRRWDGTTLERELDVATHLVEQGAPVVAPSTDPPAGPFHSRRGLTVTLWRYYAQTEPLDIGAARIALHAVHDGLARYRRPLPDFEAEFTGVTELLAASKLPQLPQTERTYLTHIGDQLAQRLRLLAGPRQALHGAPHFGNLLHTPDGPLWMDFETACYGPLEWDIAGFPGPVGNTFPLLQEDVLATLRLVRSFTVSVKCWAQYGRAPEVDDAARYHLSLLHRALI